MTPEQLAEIEQRWAKWINPKLAPKTLGGDFLILLAEVRRLNRMVDKACALIDGCPQFNTMDSSGNGNWFCKDKNCTRGKGQYADCWRKYLESEVADNG